jgi:hypothetical protein
MESFFCFKSFSNKRNMARNHYVPHFQTINYYYTNLPTKKYRYMLMFSFELNSIWVQRYK